MKRVIILYIFLFAGIGTFAQKNNDSDNTQDKNKKSDQETRYTEGASGVKRSIAYKFSNLITDEDPGNGTFRYNSDTVSRSTYIFVNIIDISGEDQTKWYSTWEKSTGASGRGQLNLVEHEGKNVNVFNVTGVFIEERGYWKIPVEYVSGSLPANGVTYYYIFERIENKDKKENEEKHEQDSKVDEVAEIAAAVTVAAVVVEPKEEPVVQITQPEPVAEVKEEPVAPPELVVEVKEEPVAQPEPVVEVKEEPVVQPEPVKEESKVEEVAATAAVVIVAAVVAEPKEEVIVQITQPEPVVEVKEEPVAQPEPVVEVKEEPVIQPEPVKEESKVEEVAAVVIVAAVVAEPKEEVVVQITQPEPVVEVKEEPAAQPEPIVEVKEEPVVQQDPVKEESKVEEVTAAAAVVTVAAVVAEPIEEVVVQITQPEPVVEVKEEPVAQPEPIVEVKEEPVVQQEPVKEESKVKEVAVVATVGTVAVASQIEKPKEEPRVRTTEPDQPAPKPQTNQPSQPKTTTQSNPSQQPVPVKKETPASQPASKPPQPASMPAKPAPTTQAPSVGNVNTGNSAKKPSDGSRRWHGIIETGYGFKIGDYGLNNYRLNFIGSYSLGQHFMIGLGIGYRNYSDKPDKHPDWFMVSSKSQVPIFLDLRVLFSKKQLTPYLALGLGSSTEKSKTDTTSYGSFINPSAGIWYRLSKNSALFAGVAYEGLEMEFAKPVDNIPFRRKNSSISLNIGIQF